MAIRLLLPFEITDPEMLAGFLVGNSEAFRLERDLSATEFRLLVRDLSQEGEHLLNRNLGFLLGLYMEEEKSTEAISPSL